MCIPLIQKYTLQLTTHCIPPPIPGLCTCTYERFWFPVSLSGFSWHAKRSTNCFITSSIDLITVASKITTNRLMNDDKFGHPPLSRGKHLLLIQWRDICTTGVNIQKGHGDKEGFFKMIYSQLSMQFLL